MTALENLSIKDYGRGISIYGGLYQIMGIALFAGLVGTSFAVLISLELAGPGVLTYADNPLYQLLFLKV